MSDERRCSRCDRLSYMGDHAPHYDCENWPEVNIGQTEVIYKGFWIGRMGSKWQFAPMYHSGGSVVSRPVEAFMQIDELRSN